MICRLSILVISFFSLFPSIVFALTLVSSGQQQAIIWISQNAGSGEEWAAREIQNYIYQISETQLPIERFSRSNSQLKYISICPIGSHLSNPELTQEDLAFFLILEPTKKAISFDHSQKLFRLLQVMILG